MKTFKEILESKKSDTLAKSIDKAMIKIDADMSVTDFALSVAKILKDEYGSHNYEDFIKVLKNNI